MERKTILIEDDFHRLLTELIDLCVRECYTDKELWLDHPHLLQCQLIGCTKSLKGRKRGAKYCSREHQHAAYQRRRRLATQERSKGIVEETYDDERVRPLKRDEFADYAVVRVSMPKRLKIRLWRSAHQANITQERLVNQILERELPPYEKWKRK